MAIVPLRLGVGVELDGIIARLGEVFDGAWEIPPALEMHGKLCGDMRCLISVMLHQLLARLAVQKRPALAYQIAVKHVLVERVREAVARRQPTVGQLLLAARLDQTMNLVEAVETLLQNQVVRAQQPGSHRRDELFAFDARVL